ncbi:Ras-specific guanine nucleotide-releasing factor RalGPS1 [Larimichthys crocea]|uniref:Ras-specific guanine nucleotide-releasing factor RalGPS1 n=1 Tax=Larimichthys crocea TaxID=215358 RepID=A0A6G0ISX7_LARCR|nr:Ras-specific guanine nucleotide-releasing factor RalGPS1 [Larimichthys crocea]
MMDLPNGQSGITTTAATVSEKSSSSESLSDKGSSDLKKSFDAVVFDVLKVTPEEYAGQITLMDAPVFKAIQPEELSSCGWNKKEKHSSAPNVVAFTRRFNQTSFWVVREILHAQTLKIRAEVLSLYIRTAKKLCDMNNLHAVMAVVSGVTKCSHIQTYQNMGVTESKGQGDVRPARLPDVQRRQLQTSERLHKQPEHGLLYTIPSMTSLRKPS